MPQSLTSSLRQTMFWHVSFLIGGLISKIKTTIDELHAYIVLKKWNLGTLDQFLYNFLWSPTSPLPPIDGSYNNFKKNVDFRHWSTAIYFNISIIVHKHLLLLHCVFSIFSVLWQTLYLLKIEYALPSWHQDKPQSRFAFWRLWHKYVWNNLFIPIPRIAS